MRPVQVRLRHTKAAFRQLLDISSSAEKQKNRSVTTATEEGFSGLPYSRPVIMGAVQQMSHNWRRSPSSFEASYRESCPTTRHAPQSGLREQSGY